MYKPCILFILSIINFSIQAQSFTLIPAGIQGTIFSSSSWGDYDNDGDLDLIVTGSTSANIFVGYNCNTTLYRNDGAGVFTGLITGIISINSGATAWGDYDNDGDLDLLISGYRDGVGGVTKIYRNNGGSFTDINAGLVGAYYGDVSWGDYDNDGYLDFIIIGEDSGIPGRYVSKIYHNNHDNTFTDIQASFIKTGRMFSDGFTDWGDYDKDGDLDLLICASTGNGIKTLLYRNDNIALFTEVDPGMLGAYQSSGGFGDYDNDGDLDILIAGRYATAFAANIYRNDGNGRFTDINAGILGVAESGAAWGDYDNDGDLDVLVSGYPVAGYNRTTNLYKNNGNDQFTNSGLPFEGVSACTINWADYDNDGDLDIFLCGIDNAYLPVAHLYRNNATTTNTVPTTPAGHRSVVSGNQVSLKWDKATDNETPQNGLGYAVYIGSAPNNVEFFSPHADLSSGWRKTVETGNVTQNTSWTIKDLPEGHYYWCVQAIDHNFAGSAFCTDPDTFTIKAVVPKEPFIPNLVTADNDGNNDTFILTGFDDGTSVSIYNRWGTLCYMNPDYKNEWDGEKESDGMYYYVIQNADRSKEWTGWVHLIK